MKGARILVVSSNDDERRNISGWLEDEGYDDVMFCPGPGAPDYTCIGSRGAPCPLSDAADLVVIDLRLRSDAMIAGTPGWQLMPYYYEQGKKIIVISGQEDPVLLRPDEQVRIIGRPAQRDELVQAMQSFASPAHVMGGR